MQHIETNSRDGPSGPTSAFHSDDIIYTVSQKETEPLLFSL